MMFRKMTLIITTSAYVVTQVVFAHGVEMAARRQPTAVVAAVEPLDYMPVKIVDRFIPASASHVAPVLIIQDIHEHSQAQRSVAGTLQEMMRNNSLSWVGVEGAFDVLMFDDFHNLPDQTRVRQVSSELLNTGSMAAPSYVGITQPSPIVYQGIDDKFHYAENLKAYVEGRKLQPQLTPRINQQQARLDNLKARIFSSEMLAFDGWRRQYQTGTLDVAAYASALERDFGFDRGEFSTVAKLVDVTWRQQKTNFQNVSRDRDRLFALLQSRINKEQMAQAQTMIHQYRRQAISVDTFNSWLREFCANAGLHLGDFKSFHYFLKTNALADAIAMDKLLTKIDSLEQDLERRLSTTDEQKRLWDENRRLHLINKLVNFELMPHEWENYKSIVNGRLSIDQGSEINNNTLIHRLLTVDHRPNLSPFERFYEQADIRSEKMVENLNKFQITNDKAQNPNEIQKSIDAINKFDVLDFGLWNLSFPPKLKVLVVGGFHAPLMTRLLREKKYSLSIGCSSIGGG
jgi:hypothetical protein